MAAERVVVLALDGVFPFELGIASRILGSAERHDGTPLYRVSTCSVDGASVRTDADFAIVPEHGARIIRRADTLVIPSPSGRGPLFDHGTLSDDVAAALASCRPGTRIVSICIASFVLAAAGLLDGRRATTHWQRAAEFRRLFPRVALDADVLFVDDGDVLTSAGVAAGIDLCLHVVRRDHGSDVAHRVARQCIVPPWRDGGQSQYVERSVPPVGAASTTATRAWAVDHLHQPLTLMQLAEHAHMSVRTFTRRFREEVGISPQQWIAHQRVDAARHLLESTDLSVEAVADRAGFGTATSMRQHLQAAIGVSPTVYRRTFTSAPTRWPT
ncbi:MAG: transcriptional regulator, AraC family with amidase-like domain [Frankiales bacterium]|nr:transcriptional regulator, AraC family with amidase-like domain [Frankiales bacterium]